MTQTSSPAPVSAPVSATTPSPVLYRALAARDSRFDGVFFVGVTSTGIYCRPICPARTPKAANCRFFHSAQAAEKESFRPCLRCRPELAPGTAPVDDAQRIAHLVVSRIDEALADDTVRLETMADQFELSARQIRRIVQKELGVSPIELIQTRRLLLAKQLLTETQLPITAVAFSSGFSSLRRFNHAFVTRYGMPPSRLRKAAAVTDRGADQNVPTTETSTLQLAYRPPYNWAGVMAFLKARAMAGVEAVVKDGADESPGESYVRSVQLGAHQGWVRVSHAPHKNALLLEFTHTLSPVLPALLSRIRQLFDLSARPDVIAAHLMTDRALRKTVKANPGLRVPGAFDGFELAVRAVLGQQVTVKAATTLAGRFAAAFGTPVQTPFAAITHLAPTPERVAKLNPASIAALGIIKTRAVSIIALAKAMAAGHLALMPGLHPAAVIDQLQAIPGLGPWTAQYIAMRALRWPDAFPTGDVAVRKNLGGVTAKTADAMSQAWSPWRSYAVLHIWSGLR